MKNISQWTETTNDDYAATSATTGVVVVASNVTGEIESAYDVDWFAVQLTSGVNYTIDLQGAPTSHGTLSDPYLRGVYNSSGGLLDNTRNDDAYGLLDAAITFTASATDTYYIAAGAFSERVGTYRLTVSTTTPVVDDYTASTTTSGLVAIAGSSSGTIEEAGDVDWWAVSLAEGVSYTIDLQGASSENGTLSDPYLIGLYDSSATLQDNTTNDDAQGGLDAQIVYQPSVAGTYYVAVGAFSKYATGTYRLSVVTTPATSDDYPNTVATTGVVTVDGNTSGNIETAYDMDVFRADLRQGYTYIIAMQGAPSNHGTLVDAVIQGIFDIGATLQSQTSNDDYAGSRDAQVAFSPTVTGSYFIAVGGYGSITGTYSLAMTATLNPIQENVITGDGQVNRLTGTAGNDLLTGAAGADRLTGNAGADYFRFTTPQDGQDTITDFSRSQGDKLQFVSANFGALAVGSLASSRLAVNTTGVAGTTSIRFIFNSRSHVLSYDPDGSARRAVVPVALLTGVARLAASDIQIVRG